MFEHFEKTDVSIVRDILENELKNKPKVHYYLVIEKIKNTVPLTKLFNKIYYENRHSKDGIKNITQGAKKLYREAFRKLKEEYTRDENLFISRRDKAFVYYKNKFNYKKILLSLLTFEWQSLLEIKKSLFDKITNEDALHAYTSYKRNSPNIDLQISSGKKRIFSTVLNKIKKNKNIVILNDNIRFQNEEKFKRKILSKNYTLEIKSLVGTDWISKAQLKEEFLNIVTDEDAQLYFKKGRIIAGKKRLFSRRYLDVFSNSVLLRTTPPVFEKKIESDMEYVRKIVPNHL